jgi:hypothetical protein
VPFGQSSPVLPSPLRVTLALFPPQKAAIIINKLINFALAYRYATLADSPTGIMMKSPEARDEEISVISR